MQISNGFLSLRFPDWLVFERLKIFSLSDWSIEKRLSDKPPHGLWVTLFGGIFIVCSVKLLDCGCFILVSSLTLEVLSILFSDRFWINHGI